MRFMMLYQPGTESTELPTREHMAEMGKLIDEMIRAGVLIDTGGLQHSSTGVRVQKTGSRVTVTDGPFTETKELIAGYAIVEAKDKAHAIELARKFLDVVGQGRSEIRPMEQAPEFAAV